MGGGGGEDKALVEPLDSLRLFSKPSAHDNKRACCGMALGVGGGGGLFFLDGPQDLLCHASPLIRSKACNLVGNLCRYDATFYAVLRRFARVGR